MLSRKYYNHLKRINSITFRNTDTTKEIIRHQIQLNEYNKFKDLSRQFNYRKKMDGLLHDNKKIYGNLAKICSHRPNPQVLTLEPNMREKEFFKRVSERNRVVNMSEIDRQNLKLAQRIATA
jgi:hypothetical protein